MKDLLIRWFYQLQVRLHTFLHRNAGVCQGFEGPCFKIGYKQLQNTAYVDDERNYVHMCDECAKFNDEYWADMWDDYYRGRL